MSPSKPSSLSLSPFARPSPTLAHFNRILASTSGQDKLFMIYAYASHIIVKVLKSKRIATKARIDLAERIGKLGSVIGDARVLYRLFGLFPIISWLQSLYHPSASSPPDATISTIEKLQAWSMILYYPLEHTYYLASKGVLTIKPKTVDRIAIWSCRFWAAYVVLQFAHIRRSSTLQAARRSALLSASATTTSDKPQAALSKEVEELEETSRRLRDDFWVQCGYLPLTVHWSLPNGLLPDQVYVGIAGTLSAAFGLRSLWRATA